VLVTRADMGDGVEAVDKLVAEYCETNQLPVPPSLE
jgi:hypothetical protein